MTDTIIGSRTRSNLVFVTHHQDEIMPCISHVLRLGTNRNNEPVAAIVNR